MNDLNDSTNRRKFMTRAGLLIGASALGGELWARDHRRLIPSPADEENVSPAEDLMREHGVLKRVLLMYAEMSDRMEKGKDFPVETLSSSANIIKTFVEDYHEKLEENYLFPRFEKAGKLVDLVKVLRLQHERGRVLTGRIQQRANASDIKDRARRQGLIRNIGLFIRMYNPHEAREDTVLFPAFRTIVSSNEYDSLGEDFEDQENKLFGDDGFEKMVDRVAGLEKTLGMDDLNKFTPKV
jgi:hemerythrin-like domain-containing protein